MKMYLLYVSFYFDFIAFLYTIGFSINLQYKTICCCYFALSDSFAYVTQWFMNERIFIRFTIILQLIVDCLLIYQWMGGIILIHSWSILQFNCIVQNCEFANTIDGNILILEIKWQNENLRLLIDGNIITIFTSVII